MSDEMLKLDNQLCFALYACSREVIKKYKPFLDPLGITYTQYITMLVLWESPRISFKNLAERLKLDSGTLTPLLKKLEAAGLVTRKRDPEDERSVILTLTEAGTALKEQAQHIPSEVFGSTGMCVNDSIALKEMLETTLMHLEQSDQ